MEKFDLVVIGGGPGGYPAAIRGAQLGASVALVEKEFMGGTCLNWGCIPTKLLIACSDAYETIRHAEAFGVRASDVQIDYAAMIARKNAVVQQLRTGIQQLLKANGVRVFRGTGSFLTRNMLAIAGAEGETRIQAGKTIIATGSVSAFPRFLPKSERIVESRAFLDLAALPRSIIVMGGGVIGCEFACMAAQLGAEVTIVEMLEEILAPLDTDVRRELKRHMESKLKIRILTGKPLEAVTVEGDRVRGSVDDQKVEADLLLVSVGRVPATDALNVERIGLKRPTNGQIPVDEFCATRIAGVFAIGDATGGLQLAHRATSQGVTAAENACSATRRKVETVIPSCYFTSPEAASAGLTEQDAKAQGIAYKTGKFPFAALGKAVSTGHTLGFVKWVADETTDRLIGAHVVGAHATDLIAEAALAIRSEHTAEEFGRTVHAHPTLSEAWVEAAHGVHGMCIHMAPKRTA